MSPPNPSRCPTCDRPVATEADWERHEREFADVATPHPFECWCDAMCWAKFNGACDGIAVDWRARAMEAERALADSIPSKAVELELVMSGYARGIEDAARVAFAFGSPAVTEPLAARIRSLAPAAHPTKEKERG